MLSSSQELLDGLAKPKGSLGKLETVALKLCIAQGKCQPELDCSVVVFAGDHGVALSEKVSAFPQSVSRAMVETMLDGKAAVNCLARNAGCGVQVVNLGLVTPFVLESERKVADGVQFVDAYVGAGTKNLANEAAMSKDQLQACLQAGRDAVLNAKCNILAIGELGIGNTTAAAALAAKILGVNPELVVGPGTGLDDSGVQAKTAVIRRALKRIQSTIELNPLDVLAELGGFEIAAMVGCILECANQGVAAVIDGFICSSAALIAARINPNAIETMIFATLSAEPGHRLVLDGIKQGIEPLLEWQMRLGEASGAALALPLIQAGGRILTEMATLEEVLATRKE